MSAKGLPISKLIEAIRQASLYGVIDALDTGCDIEEADQHGQRGLPLRTACFSGKIEVVRELISRGANVNATGSDGPGMPLRLALRAGHKDIVNLLLASGADIPPGVTLPGEVLALASTSAATPELDILLIADEPAPTTASTAPPPSAAEFPDMEFTLAPKESSASDFLPGHGALIQTSQAPARQPDYQVDEVVDITGSYGIDTNLLNMDLLHANENGNKPVSPGAEGASSGKKKDSFWKSGGPS